LSRHAAVPKGPSLFTAHTQLRSDNPAIDGRSSATADGIVIVAFLQYVVARTTSIDPHLNGGEQKERGGYEKLKNEWVLWNSRIDPQNRSQKCTSEVGGEGCDEIQKTTHNSVVEASPYTNECFVPEIRDEFRASH
jgi:hypothetical protein